MKAPSAKAVEAALEYATRLTDVVALCRPEHPHRLKVGWDGPRAYLQVSAYLRDNTGRSSSEKEHFGRKWLLSPHMTDGEIVQTALKAVLTFAEHEIRERFTYRGVSVFDPHYDIEALVALRSAPSGSLKERT